MGKKNDDDNGKFEKMDSDSLMFLEQVRKGKLRNFVMSVKGQRVRSLVVKKKRIKKDELVNARGGGFQPMFGVVEGMAAKITFKIAKSDGFEADPLGGKVIKLKEFLKDQTGKVFKPLVEVVATPPPIPFDEDDLQDPLIARFMNLAEAISRYCDNHPNEISNIEKLVNDIRSLLSDDDTRKQAQPKIVELENLLEIESTSDSRAMDVDQPATEDQTVLKGKLAEGLKKLKPAVQQAIIAAPNRKGELVATMTQIADEIKEERFDAAKSNMVAFGKLLRGLISQDASAKQNMEAAADQNVDGNLAAKLSEDFKKLKGAVEQAIALESSRKTEFVDAMTQIANQIKAQEFDAARNGLLELGTIIKQILAAGTDTQSTSDRFELLYRGLSETIPADLNRLRAIDETTADKIEKIVTAGDAHADDKKFENAYKYLSKAAEAIANAFATSRSEEATAEIPAGIVAEMRAALANAKTRWDAGIVRALSELQKVQDLIVTEDNELADALPEIVESYEADLNSLLDSTNNSLDGEETSQLRTNTLAMANALKSEIESDELISELDQYPNAGANIRNTFLQALSDVKNELNR